MDGVRAVATPIATVLAAFATAGVVLRRPVELSASEVATTIRDCIESTGGKWDWSDFTSIPILDPDLDAIREKASAVEFPVDGAGKTVLHGLLLEAERLAANGSSS